jgi:hypothetical protein
VGEGFIKAAAARVTKLGSQLEELAALEVDHGAEALVGALSRALELIKGLSITPPGITHPDKPRQP